MRRIKGGRAAVLVGVGLTMTACTSARVNTDVDGSIGGTGDGSKPSAPVANPGNKTFYRDDGAFAVEAAKQAYYDMMAAYRYPIPAILKGKDFGWTDKSEIEWVKEKYDMLFTNKLFQRKFLNKFAAVYHGFCFK